MRARYAAAGRAAEQRDEDLVGRRLLTSVGFSNPAKNIFDYERGLLGRPGDENAPFIERAIALALCVLNTGENLRRICGGTLVLSCEKRTSVGKLLEVLEEDAADAGMTIVHVAREADSVCSASYRCRTSAMLHLAPPYSVLAYYKDGYADAAWAAITQPLNVFCEQIGPFHVSTGN